MWVVCNFCDVKECNDTGDEILALAHGWVYLVLACEHLALHGMCLFSFTSGSWIKVFRRNFWLSVQGHRMLPTERKYIQRQQGFSEDDCVKINK